MNSKRYTILHINVKKSRVGPGTKIESAYTLSPAEKVGFIQLEWPASSMDPINSMLAARGDSGNDMGCSDVEFIKYAVINQFASDGYRLVTTENYPLPDFPDVTRHVIYMETPD